MKKLLSLAVTGIIALSACGEDIMVADVASLQIVDVAVGTGATAEAGKRVYVHYTGWLYDEHTADHHGKKFDSSRDHGGPIDFVLGRGEVIQGWEQGIAGMKVGGRRTLIIPSSMAYGAVGRGEIPGGAALVFDVELMNVQ